MEKIDIVLRVVREGDIVTAAPPCMIDANGNCLKHYDLRPYKRDYWHLGGLIMLNFNVTEIIICEDKDLGEGYEGECYNKGSLNFNAHNNYFMKDTFVGNMC